MSASSSPSPGDRANPAAAASSGDAASATLPLGQAFTHYACLQVSSQASPAELRQAFRQLSKRYHPDTTTLPREQAEEAFRRLQQAYAVLIDPLSRRRYDALLQPGVTAQAFGDAGAAPGMASSGPAGAAAAPGSPGWVASGSPASRRSASGAPAEPRPVGVRRSLSGGEWFALLLLAMALVLSLVLGLGVAWARGAALVRSPSWWPEAGPTLPPATAAPTAPLSPSAPPDAVSTSTPSNPVSSSLSPSPSSVPPARDVVAAL